MVTLASGWSATFPHEFEDGLMYRPADVSRMRTMRLKKLVVAAWLGLGVLQIANALVGGDWFFLALGVAYTLLGVAYFWFEIHEVAS